MTTERWQINMRMALNGIVEIQYINNVYAIIELGSWRLRLQGPHAEVGDVVARHELSGCEETMSTAVGVGKASQQVYARLPKLKHHGLHERW